MLMPFKGLDLDFFFPLMLSESLLWLPRWSLCSSCVLVGHFTETYVLWQAEADSSFPKDEKHVTENIRQAQGKALWVLHNHKERESRSRLEPVLFVKEKEKRVKKKVSDNFVLSQLLKPNRFVRGSGSDPSLRSWVSHRFGESVPRRGQTLRVPKQSRDLNAKLSNTESSLF